MKLTEVIFIMKTKEIQAIIGLSVLIGVIIGGILVVQATHKKPELTEKKE
jgi:hypothetical protein